MMARQETFLNQRLCSSRDPIREASLWCDQLEKNECFMQREAQSSHYWVVGLGAGYHIEELAHRKPKSVISVLEFREDLIVNFTHWGSALRGQVLVEKVENISSVFETGSFRAYGLNHSSVYTFMPAVMGARAWAESLQQGLLARSAEGLHLYSQEMQADFHEAVRGHSLAQGVTVKSICNLLDGQPMSAEKKAFTLLRELIK